MQYNNDAPTIARVNDTDGDLPEDIEALKRMVLEHRALLDSRAREIESLKLLIAKLKRMQFGRSSERLAREIEQLELALDELEAEAPVATSAAAVSMAHRRDECTGELGSPSAPKDLNIGATAAIGCGGSLEDPTCLRTTSVGRDGTTAGRGATGEGPAAGGVTGGGARAIGRHGRAPRCRTRVSTSRLGPFSNRSSAVDNSSSDLKGSASTASSPRAIV